MENTGLSEKNITNDLELSSISDSVPDADLVEDFEQFIRATRIQNPMAIENFLNPVNEDEWAQEALNDEEIGELIRQLDSDTSQVDLGEIIDIPPPHCSLSTKNKICIFAQAIALVEDSFSGWWDENKESTIESLRVCNTIAVGG